MYTDTAAKTTALSVRNLILFCLTALTLGGCGTTTIEPDYPEPTSDEQLSAIYLSGPAGSLYSQAKSEIDSGNYHKAEQILERALRIEPNNGYYWYSLARVKYQTHNYPQAIQLSLKSKSKAGNDYHLIRLNNKLIASAEKATR